jgi:hypothetical protein
MQKILQRCGMSTVLIAAVSWPLGCGRPPTLTITAETLPAQARSLALSLTRTVPGVGEQASAEPLRTYDLPEPTPSRQSLLLRLPSGFSGTLNLSLAAFSATGGAGCLQRLGYASHAFTPQPYDDALVLPLDVDPGDRDCEAAPPALPRLLSATPSVVGTAGGDSFRLLGWGFAPGAEVLLDDSKLGDVRVQSGFELTAVATARTTPGSVRLRVVLPGGASVERSDLIRYRFSSPAFTAQPTVSAPYSVSSIAYGDIDGDGSYDVLLSPATGNRLTSLLAKQVLTNYSIGGAGAPGPVTPAILADLDLDGRPDLVTGYLPNREVQTRRNSGNGAIYESSMVYPLSAEPTYVHASDLDRDGYLDVIALSETGRSLSVLLNDRSGRLGAAKATSLATTSAPFSLASVDMNLDGLKDLVIIDRSQPVARTLPNGMIAPGVFPAIDNVALVSSLSGPASSIIARDLDGDGNSDVLLAIESKGELLVAYSRTGLAVLSSPIKTCAAPRLATAADLDADGTQELIVSCSSEQQVQVLQKRSDGSYGELLRSPVPASLGGVIGLTAIDYDSDGRTDIILSGSLGFGLLRNESK